jgi:hypothetical protein
MGGGSGYLYGRRGGSGANDGEHVRLSSPPHVHHHHSASRGKEVEASGRALYLPLTYNPHTTRLPPTHHSPTTHTPLAYDRLPLPTTHLEYWSTLSGEPCRLAADENVTSSTLQHPLQHPALLCSSTVAVLRRLVHIGLSELLVFTLSEYEDLAVSLLTNKPRLAQLRQARLAGGPINGLSILCTARRA